MEKRARIIVYGLVQGVGFRMFVERCATRLDLKGWVKNRQDGSVEIDVQGAAGLVDELLDNVRIGPPASKVASMSVSEKTPDFSQTDFTILL